jgi:hypothetical protein
MKGCLRLRDVKMGECTDGKEKIAMSQGKRRRKYKGVDQAPQV